jgi:CHAT domain-containing protein
MNYIKSIVLAGFILSPLMGPVGSPAIAQPPLAANPSADPLFQQGLQQSARNQYEPAIQSFTQALAQYRNLKDRNGERLALGNLGLVYESLKNYPKAIDLQEASLAIALETKNRPGEAQALANLANLYHRLKDDPKAIALIERNLVITRELKQQQGKDYSLEELGRIYAYFRAYPQVIATQTQRILLVRKANDRLGEAKTLETLGTAYSGIADYQNAIASYQNALSINREIKLLNPNIDRSLANLGDVYQKSGDDVKAIAYYQQVSALQGSKYDLNTRIKVLGKLGHSFAKVGNLPEAETALRSAIAAEETFRSAPSLSDAIRLSSVDRQVENHQLLQQVLIRQNRAEAALEVAEQGRSRALVELLRTRQSDPNTPKFTDLAKSPNLESIRRIAKEQNATLVEYSIVSPDLLYIWVIKPTGEITFRSTKLDPQQPVNRLVSNSRSGIGVRARIQIQRVGKASAPEVPIDTSLTQLHQMLIDPIASELPTDPNQLVIFLPQGELFLLPFAALRDRQGKYLIERHTIATAPSIQTLDLTHKQPARAIGPTLIVGDPTMPQVQGDQLQPLPGARKEAIAIGKILNTTPLLGDQATKTTVLDQMRTASLVHLATHGLLDTIDGTMPGAIALAPQGQDSGLLTANEIFDLNLSANLVVLSACDTGRGEIKSDGVIGLSRSLIAAGVPTVVVSLWAVNDSSTSVLMSDFYRNLEANPNKAQALRKAMLMTMKQYPNPSDWAAFMLVGESDR